MLYTRFRANRSSESGEYFERFITYMVMVAILVMCSKSCHLILFSSYEKACIQNLAENGLLLSEKSHFQFWCVNNLGPRSRNNLDLKLSHYFAPTTLPVTGCNSFDVKTHSFHIL